MDKIFLSMDKIFLPINGIFILQILYKILCVMFSNESLPMVGFSCLSLLMCDFEPKSDLLNYINRHLKNMIKDKNPSLGKKILSMDKVFICQILSMDKITLSMGKITFSMGKITLSMDKIILSMDKKYR